ncbi:MAG TPA: hypothetical protein VH040_07260 [Usitatibacter sp.]|nr:hypothetical protein [Usitatibacter sp.]
MTPLVLLAACGAASTVRLDISPPATIGFRFSDTRPSSDREPEQRRLSIGQEIALGDNAIAPRPPDLVRSWLAREAATSLAGKAVELRRFRIEVSVPDGAVDEARFASSANSVPGANPVSVGLAKLFMGGIESSRTTKTVMVYLSVSVDGKEVENNTARAFSGRVSEANIQETILAALEGISRKLNG